MGLFGSAHPQSRFLGSNPSPNSLTRERWLSGLEAKRLCSKPIGPEFEPRGRDRGCALLKGPIIERIGPLVLPGF